MPGSSFQTSGGIQQTKSKSSRCHFGYVGSSVLCCVCFKKMDGTNEFRQVGSNLEKRLKSTCPRKRCQTLPEMILVFWCVESMFVFCWFVLLGQKTMRLTTFSRWLQDWNLLSHRCKSSCWKRPLGALFPYSMSCWHALNHQKRCWWWWLVCVCVLVSCKNAWWYMFHLHQDAFWLYYDCKPHEIDKANILIKSVEFRFIHRNVCLKSRILSFGNPLDKLC